MEFLALALAIQHDVAGMDRRQTGHPEDLRAHAKGAFLGALTGDDRDPAALHRDHTA